MSGRKAYPSDLTDAEWAVLEPLLPPPAPTGRPATVDRREILNAIFYQLRTGCQWRYLPEGFPKWQTVYWHFARWVDGGVFEQINDALRRRLREHRGRDPDPSAAIADSQSVTTTEKGGTAATMAASRSAVASATSSLIRKAC